MPDTDSHLKFPKRFLWGAATSAHQVEGGLTNNWTHWEQANAKTLSKTAEYKLSHLPKWDDFKHEACDPDTYVSGEAIDHFRRYEYDFQIAEKLNLNAFRFSIEWSRIEPEPGVWNREAIDHYRAYIKDMKKRGLEPLMTLYHWTVPTWFEELGGFEKAANIKYFVRFAERVIDEYHHDIRYITSINEPDTVMSHGYLTLDHPPQKRSVLKALVVYRNLLKSHKLIHSYARSKSRRLKVGMTKSYAWVRPGDDSFLTKLAVRVDFFVRDDLVIRYVRRHTDFLGVNYYFSDRRFGLKIDNETSRPNDLGWEMRPADIKYVLLRLKKWKKPLMITESGVADRDDEHRKWWIATSLAGVYQAMNSGVEILGYMHWSLFDNFEWAYGRWPRFGLVAIDYENNLKRTVRPSGIWYGKLVKKMRGK